MSEVMLAQTSKFVHSIHRATHHVIEDLNSKLWTGQDKQLLGDREIDYKDRGSACRPFPANS
jgi:hypothetical protein